MELDASMCVPLAEAPKSEGEACAVEPGAPQVDDCAIGLSCHRLESPIGTCQSICSGTADAPSCPPGLTCYFEGHSCNAPLCLPACDPTAPICPEGYQCMPTCETGPDGDTETGMYCGSAFGDGFACAVPIAAQQVGEGCLVASCVAGAFCAVGDDPPVICRAFCDLELPDSCPPPTHCTPWFSDLEDAPPNLAHVGYCT